ncbi:MAG: DUF554 domain-containing protein [Peptococcia bacterium]
MFGTLVNVAAIIVGALIGITLRKGIAERFKLTIMHGIGLVVCLIGVNMAIKTSNEIIVILSMVVGGLIGEILDIEGFLTKLGKSLNNIVKAEEGDFIKAFVSSSLVYCVGAMSIMGSFQSGLTGEHSILLAKSALDGITAIVFSSSMGIGVIFSALPVLIYQGLLTLLAESVQGILTDPVVREMTATGGLLIVAIGVNMLGFNKFKVANLLPAIFVAIIFTLLAARFFPAAI